MKLTNKQTEKKIAEHFFFFFIYEAEQTASVQEKRQQKYDNLFKKFALLFLFFFYCQEEAVRYRLDGRLASEWASAWVSEAMKYEWRKLSKTVTSTKAKRTGGTWTTTEKK